MYLLSSECVKFEALLLTFDFDIQHFWVNAEGQVAWQGPGCGRPGNQSHFLVLNQWEADDDRRVLNVLKAKNGPNSWSILRFTSQNCILSPVLHQGV